MKNTKNRPDETIEATGLKFPVWVLSEPRFLLTIVSVALIYAALFSNIPRSEYQKLIFFSVGILLLVVNLLINLVVIRNRNSQKAEIEAKYSSEERIHNIAKKQKIVDITTNQEILHEIIEGKFINIPDCGKVFQTYLGAFPIAGQRDLIDCIPDEKRCEVERIFGITSAFEINFACASIEKMEYLRSERNGKVKLNNKLIILNSSDIEFGFITNITLFDDIIILTYKTSGESKYLGHPEVASRVPPLFAGSSTTMALVLFGKELAERFDYSFRHRFVIDSDSNIEEIKKSFYQRNRLEYLAAIAYSIAKEIAFIADLNPYDPKNKGERKIGYIGIVGSLAEQLVSNIDNSAKNINDIDLLIFIENASLNLLKEIYKRANDVARRYSIQSLFNISIDEDIAPIFNHPESNINVQLLINDFNSNIGRSFVGAIKPSKFTMATRLHCNFRLNGELHNYYFDEGITYQDLLSEEDPFSLVQLINAVEKGEIGRRYWDHDLMIMKEKKRILKPNELSMFYQYCLKWGLINFYFATTNKEQRDGVSFQEMMYNATKILDLDAIGQINNIRKDDCLRLLKKAKKIAEEALLTA